LYLAVLDGKIMKAFLPFFLVVIIGISSFKHASIYVAFKLNQKSIAKNLCVERDVEDSTCGGCCQLKKKQEEQNTKEDAPNPQRKLQVNTEWFCAAKFDLRTQEEDVHSKPWVFALSHYKSNYSPDCFRPPQYL
jgi:hypothetical protein